MASGKTLLMRNIRKPAPIVLHRNIGAPRAVRRSRKGLLGWKGALVPNETYVYPARDQRKGRKLRSIDG